MNLLDAAKSLLIYFPPEMRSIPDDATYPGCCGSVLKAINGALQEFYATGPTWKRKGTRGTILSAPVSVLASVTHGSDEIDFGVDWQDAFAGCTVAIAGAATDNELLGSESANTLLLPHDGPSGTVSVLVLGDCVTLAADVFSVLAPVQIVDGPPLSPVPTKGHLQLRSPSENDYGRHLLVPSARISTARKSQSTGTPQLYCVEAGIEDPYSAPVMHLRVSPAPNADTTITHEARLKIPVFTIANLTPGTLNIPVPHDYAESIFLPIATKRLVESPFFRQGPHTTEIGNQYQIARTQLEQMAPQSRPAATMRPLY